VNKTPAIYPLHASISQDQSVSLPPSFCIPTTLSLSRFTILRISRTLPHLSLPHLLQMAIRIHYTSILDRRKASVYYFINMQTSGPRRISTESGLTRYAADLPILVTKHLCKKFPIDHKSTPPIFPAVEPSEAPAQKQGSEEINWPSPPMQCQTRPLLIPDWPPCAAHYIIICCRRIFWEM
jgi:hypothetical protein